MKQVKLISLLMSALLLSPIVFSMEGSQRPETISFTDNSDEPYFLMPIDQFGEERFGVEVSALFQNESVYQYYERGTRKSVADCTAIFQRVCGRCAAVKDGEQLGWEIVLDKNKEFVGFIGAAITQEKKIEFCIAIKPDLQRRKVATRGLYAYFNEHWNRLKPDVRESITHIKAPINPRNESSRQLAESLFEGCIEDKVYVPSYYQNLSKEKGERKNIEIPIGRVLAKLAEMNK